MKTGAKIEIIFESSKKIRRNNEKNLFSYGERTSSRCDDRICKQTSHTPMTAQKHRCLKGLKDGRCLVGTSRLSPVFVLGEQHQDGIKLGLSWDQVGTKSGLSWDQVEKLFVALQEPKSMVELKELYRWSNTTKFKAKYVSPLIEAKFVGMALPDKPTSPKQRYFLTDNGKALLANVIRKTNTGDLVEKVNHIIGNLSEEEKRVALELLHKKH